MSGAKPKPAGSLKGMRYSAFERMAIQRMRRATPAERVAWLRETMLLLHRLSRDAHWWRQAADDIDQEVHPTRDYDVVDRDAPVVPREKWGSLEDRTLSIGGVLELVHNAAANASALWFTEDDWREIERRLAGTTRRRRPPGRKAAGGRP